MSSKANKGDAERDARIRKAMLAGETHAAIAAAEGVSVSTVRRSLKATTESTLDLAAKAGAADRAEKAEARKAERKLAAVPEAGPAKPEPKAAAPKRAPGEAIDLDAVVASNARWTDEDRTAVREALVRIGAAKFFQQKGYIRVKDADGQTLAAVEGSRVLFSDKDLATLVLSTARKAAASA